MQVIIDAFDSPAEKRLTAAFLNNLADLQELQQESLNAQLSQVTVAELAPTGTEPAQPEVAPAGKPKRTPRAEKEKPADAASAVENSAANSSASETSSKPADAGETGNSSAAGADTAKESGSTGTAEPAVTHDDLRAVFGKLTQDGKGDAAIAALGKQGFKSIKSIPAESLADALKTLQAL